MEIPYTVTPRKDTGLYNSKVGIWLFLASEVMLFGGLFSGYVFLRIYADYPWPERALPVVPGLINTFILIASSVTVVFAWAALKMRKWRQFQIFMLITLACAGIFMVLKGIEYSAKWGHQAVRMKDFTIVEGHTHKAVIDAKGNVSAEHGTGHASKKSSNNGVHFIASGEGQHAAHGKPVGQFAHNKVVFTADRLVIDLRNYHEGTLSTILEQSAKQTGVKWTLAQPFISRPNVKVDEKEVLAQGAEFNFSNLAKARVAFIDARTNNSKVRTDQHRAAWADLKKKPGNADKSNHELKDSLKLNTDFDQFIVRADSSLLFTTETPCTFYLTPKDVRESADKAILRDGSTLEGKLNNEASIIELAADAIDFRFVAQHAVEKGIDPQTAINDTWIIKNNPAIAALWQKHHEHILKLEKELKKDGRVPTDTERYRITWQELVNYGEGKIVKGVFSGFAGPNHKQDYAKHFPEVTVPRDQVYLETVFSPRWNTYYAIYFLITGLHGLHVIGGAIVLGYFVFFGKKMYLNNPEHLANRVEVGGLFWHFVDLIWIFLFPILYLM